MKRDMLREERRRERERERRLAEKGNDYASKRSKISRDRDRDIGEKIALGQANIKATGEALYDQRLFNQDKGMSAGFGAEDDYNLYDKDLFTGSKAGSGLYRPTTLPDEDVGGQVGCLYNFLLVFSPPLPLSNEYWVLSSSIFQFPISFLFLKSRRAITVCYKRRDSSQIKGLKAQKVVVQVLAMDLSNSKSSKTKRIHLASISFCRVFQRAAKQWTVLERVTKCMQALLEGIDNGVWNTCL